MSRKIGLAIVALAVAACEASTNCPAGKNDCARVVLGVDGKARACEVVLAETGGKLGRVEFADDVKGKWLRQGDKLAAAFHATSDASIGKVEVFYAGASAQASFEVASSRCYDARGVELSGVQVRR